MALSLDAIYTPLNEFFLRKFAGAEPAGIRFRFARLPRAFVDSDFVAPSHPEWGPLQALGEEQFSEAVDGIPFIDADGRTVWFGTDRLSDLYRDEILGPSTGCVPDSMTDADQRQAGIDSFNAAKAAALSLWESIKSESVLAGPGVAFRPSAAAPASWWNRNDPQVWSSQAFHVASASGAPPGQKLLRMKVSDEVLRGVLKSHVAPDATPAVAPAPPHDDLVIRKLSPQALAAARPVFMTALAANSGPAVAAPAPRRIGNPFLVGAEVALPPAALHTDVNMRIERLPVRERFELQSMLAAQQPLQPVATSEVTLRFDYCVVTVTRPWLHQAFLKNAFWCIPGQAKGKLSANDGHGMPALPVGFVAVKELTISGTWTPDDISNLQQSVQFGPFNFDSAVVDGAIGHSGIQIVGWLLQDVPDLPPNRA